jgi:two-component system alkaline phosphatase synthesis response regulator PhoP
MKKKKGDEFKKTKSLNILVADDDEGMRKMFMKWLSVEEHGVKTASNGEKALELIKKEYFDVVFLDVIMPGRPCLSVLEYIKKISRKTQVVMITGRMLDEEFRKKVKQKGASQQLQKPFTMEDVNNCLAKIMAGLD